MKKTSELIGAELDYWVAMAGEEWERAHKYYPTMTLDPTFSSVRIGEWPRGEYGALIATCILEPSNPFRQDPKPFCPSEEWEHGGPIIDREHIWLSQRGDTWFGSVGAVLSPSSGPTPLIAAMRAYVASVFGEEVG